MTGFVECVELNNYSLSPNEEGQLYASIYIFQILLKTERSIFAETLLFVIKVKYLSGRETEIRE